MPYFILWWIEQGNIRMYNLFWMMLMKLKPNNYIFESTFKVTYKRASHIHSSNFVFTSRCAGFLWFKSFKGKFRRRNYKTIFYSYKLYCINYRLYTIAASKACWFADFSPIEHVWDFIGLRLSFATGGAHNKNEIWHKAETIWNAISQDYIQKLYVLMSQCVLDLISQSTNFWRFVCFFIFQIWLFICTPLINMWNKFN